MLSVFSAVLLCAQSVAALAADTTSTATDQQVRVQVDAQRAQLSGVDKITPAAQKNSSTLLDTPVDTEDAPAQVQRP
ncbi:MULTISPECIES: hypothetical protein [Pseudomonas syringae group]|uniref:hypothetical protein n=1 Tax=Pseudomonas syringae group TaxID=136849 RepID=UPI001604F0A3|nr:MULTISPECIES: hypothetical protein [Pseudomonas syringae group]UQB39318.1 hypothetical protein I9H09_11460 [Pseudomonas tremae]